MDCRGEWIPTSRQSRYLGRREACPHFVISLGCAFLQSAFRSSGGSEVEKPTAFEGRPGSGSVGSISEASSVGLNSINQSDPLNQVKPGSALAPAGQDRSLPLASAPDLAPQTLACGAAATSKSAATAGAAGGGGGGTGGVGSGLGCPLCSALMSAAVQLRPCGHSFCAACLSQHMGAQLQGGVPLACPFRSGRGREQGSSSHIMPRPLHSAHAHPASLCPSLPLLCIAASATTDAP